MAQRYLLKRPKRLEIVEIKKAIMCNAKNTNIVTVWGIRNTNVIKNAMSGP